MDKPILKQNKILAKNDIYTEGSEEPFIDLERINNTVIFFDPRYYKRNLPGAMKNFYVRKTAAVMLAKAALKLPEGCCFKIFDAWRPYSVQKALYDEFYNKLHKEHPELDDPALHMLTQRFVSVPDLHAKNPCLHSTGGAIDLTLADKTGRSLDLGTDFDSFMPEAQTVYFEEHGLPFDSGVIRNRRILYNAMTGAGFTNFQNEWWHYDYGDTEWSSYTGSPAIYGGVYEASKLNIKDVDL